ncbi:MAG: trehalose synthase [Actinomycetota bacterium]|nr:trehalose synthase [Actinomycetota bacterium]
MKVNDVPIEPLPYDRFAEVLPPERFREFEAAVVKGREAFEGRIVWNVNSTARGGGVAEMLRSLIARARGAGIDARWVVISGGADFFSVTKRIHNHLHGSKGDGGGLGAEEKAIYEQTLEPNASELSEKVRPGDVVLLHDPQTAGLASALLERGAVVIWRCHVGVDVPNRLAQDAWRFLIPYIRDVDAYVFSRQAFEWEGLDRSRVSVIPPSIDAFSPKNQDMSPDQVNAILSAAGVTQVGSDAEPVYSLVDGSTARCTRKVVYRDGGESPPADCRIVLQVSRWDRLKDPLGVMQGFVDGIADDDVHLIVAGPSVEAVADDPEGAQVLEEVYQAWSELPASARDRVHLAMIPMDDGDENAAIVNAMQRRADVVVQKSLAEGFGLTVAEAMWKGRAVVASRIGGIQDQIEDGKTGLLVDDPTDLDEYGSDVKALLDDPDRAEQMGAAARDRVRDNFLGPRHLIQYQKLMSALLERKS